MHYKSRQWRPIWPGAEWPVVHHLAEREERPEPVSGQAKKQEKHRHFMSRGALFADMSRKANASLASSLVQSCL